MKVQGQRDKLSRWIRGDDFVVRVVVETVYPYEAPYEPCLEPDTIRHLDHLQELANTGDMNELAKHGEVYVRRSA